MPTHNGQIHVLGALEGECGVRLCDVEHRLQAVVALQHLAAQGTVGTPSSYYWYFIFYFYPIPVSLKFITY